MKKLFGSAGRVYAFFATLVAMLLTPAATVFAAGDLPSVTPVGGSSSGILSAVNQFIGLADNFGLQYLQGAVVVVIAFFVIWGAVQASRAKNFAALWTEIGFGVLGIIFVVNPTLVIAICLRIGSLFGGAGL